jgi:AraC-like DNA-binding protein
MRNMHLQTIGSPSPKCLVGGTGHPQLSLFCPGDRGQAKFMKKVQTNNLFPIEKEAIAEIRAVRNASGSSPLRQLQMPAHFIHHLIVSTHGHVQLRIFPLAQEIGVEVRTLERSFRIAFGQTMSQCQADTRLTYAKWLLSMSTPIKIAAIASMLGYGRAQDFNRFFKKRMQRTPSEWAEAERTDHPSQ